MEASVNSFAFVAIVGRINIKAAEFSELMEYITNICKNRVRHSLDSTMAKGIAERKYT